jgi:tRNA threonylcarbamoyladenosine biosynthesis protein TsaE
MKTFVTRSSQETIDLGKSFAATIAPGDVVALVGNLGTGKTQFVRGVCAGLNVHGHVASPTFTMIHEYDVSFGKVVHIDLYRVASRAEVAELGIEDYFNDNCICLIEWAERVLDVLPPHHYEVRMQFGDADDERKILIGEVDVVDSPQRGVTA